MLTWVWQNCCCYMTIILKLLLFVTKNINILQYRLFICHLQDQRVARYHKFLII